MAKKDWVLSGALASLVFLAVLAGGPVWPTSAQPQSPFAGTSSPLPIPQAPAALGKASAVFFEEVDSSDTGSRFRVRGADSTMYLGDDAVWLVLSQRSEAREAQPAGSIAGAPAGPPTSATPASLVNLRLTFPGANPHPTLEPFNRLPTRLSYFIGNDPAGWSSDAPAWGGLRYRDLYPGIDLEVSSLEGRAVQRLLVQPGADLGAVRLKVEGAEALAVEGNRLLVSTALGEFNLPLLEAVGPDGASVALEQAPRLDGWEISAPLARPSPAGYDASPAGEGAAAAADLIFATFLGGSGDESGGVGAPLPPGVRIAVGADGAAYVAGSTFSSDFPVTAGAVSTTLRLGEDIFVAKLNAAGTALEYATFLGGTSTGEEAAAIAVDSQGSAYITGQTPAPDFPTTVGSYSTGPNGFIDAFVVKLSPAGSSLAYSTRLGGSGNDIGAGIAVDGSGAAFVTGYTESSSFPTTPGAADTTHGGGACAGGFTCPDAFVTKLNPAGSAPVYSTFLGGSNYDMGYDIAVDDAGAAYITGFTSSSNFPATVGALDTQINGASDNFAAKLSPSGNALAYATFLDNGGRAIALDSGKAAYVGGGAYVMKLNASGSALAYTTVLTGTSVADLAVDGSGDAYVTGYTTFGFTATPGAYDTAVDGGQDAFVARLSSDGAVAYASYLGGSANDSGSGISLGGSGTALIAGLTYSANFPVTPGALDTTLGGTFDAFVARMNVAGPPPTYSIKGRVAGTGGSSIAGVTVSAGSALEATTDAGGNYTIANLAAGTYTLTTSAPAESGLVFWPVTRTATLPPAATQMDFTGIQAAEDADGDALLNGWEVKGYDADGDGIIDVRLPVMGANPLRKDVFVEIDYMVALAQPGGPITHTHRPKDRAMTVAVEAFKFGQVSNPDGSTGITLHLDYGPDTTMDPSTGAKWGQLSRSNALPLQNTLQRAGTAWNWSGLDRIENTQGNFDPKRARIFHYVLFAHELGGDVKPGTSGISRNDDSSDAAFRKGASDLVVSLGDWTDSVGTVRQQAGTFLHELGHNLGLRHGGDDFGNYEPNYLSVMNYSYQTTGVIFDSNFGYFLYSESANVPPLDEAHLNETAGLGWASPLDKFGLGYFCRPNGVWESRVITNANGPIDWNCQDGASGPDIAANINDGREGAPDPTVGVLRGWADWPNLVFDGGAIGLEPAGASAVRPAQSVAGEELTFEDDRKLFRPYDIVLSGGADIVAPAGATSTSFITLTNAGALTATVSISYTSGLGWFNLEAVPASRTLSPNGTLAIPVTLTIPASPATGAFDQVVISAAVQESPLIGDSTALRAYAGAVANFVAEPASGGSPLVVNFTDASAGNVSSRLWDFGDGATSGELNPTHSYIVPGTYTVTLTVTGPDGSNALTRPELVRVNTSRIYLPILSRND